MVYIETHVSIMHGWTFPLASVYRPGEQCSHSCVVVAQKGRRKQELWCSRTPLAFGWLSGVISHFIRILFSIDFPAPGWSFTPVQKRCEALALSFLRVLFSWRTISGSRPHVLAGGMGYSGVAWKPSAPARAAAVGLWGTAEGGGHFPSVK